MAIMDFHPNVIAIKPLLQFHGVATINIGGEAKLVIAPPTEIFTNNSASVVYFSDLEGFRTKNFSDKSIEQMVIAAGPVINELKKADSSSIANHQASMVPWKILTIRQSINSKNFKIGRLEAMIIITMINNGST